MGPIRHSARRRGAHAPRGAHPTRVRLSEGAPLLQAPRAGCPCSQCRGCAWSEAPAASTGGGGRARLDLCTRESRTPGRQRLRETEAPGVGLAPTRGPVRAACIRWVGECPGSSVSGQQNESFLSSVVICRRRGGGGSRARRSPRAMLVELELKYAGEAGGERRPMPTIAVDERWAPV